MSAVAPALAASGNDSFLPRVGFNPPLRILHVVNSLDPGGMENGITNLARGLAPSGVESHVACLERGGDFIERLPRPELARVLNAPEGFRVATAWRLNRLIAQVQPDVVHSHNIRSLIYSALATVHGLTRPLLHGEHGQLPADQRTPRVLRLRRLFYRACTRIHTVSAGLQQHLVDAGLPVDKVVPILNGVDTDRFHPGDRRQARAALGLSAEAQVIGIVGRFVALKRHDLLIEAFEALPAVPHRVLLIVGDGGSESAVVRARVAASPCASRIILLGHRKDTVTPYQAMDLLAAPSAIEGLSNVVLEAMACGVPVLAHTACGNAEAIASTQDGLLAALDTPAVLCQELRCLLDDPTRLPRLGEAARTKMVQRFSLQRMLAEYARLYAGLAKRPWPET